MNHQEVFNIAEICSKHGIRHAVISPGSRNALLTLSFSRHPNISCTSVPDERCAAFTALGMAQSGGEPVALICTSGTAALNFSPAIAEAFFSETPLLVFTADRPPELTDQFDGQTIRQQNLYGTHVKRWFQLPVDGSHPDAKWHFQRNLNEGILEATRIPLGPVHFNVPIREPFYPADNELEYSEVKITKGHTVPDSLSSLPEELTKNWEKAERILIVPGQGPFSEEVEKQLNRLSSSGRVAIIADNISNTNSSATRHHDLWLSVIPNSIAEVLKPDLVISFGHGILSKSLKLFLREYSSAEHWHLSPDSRFYDTYQSLTGILNGDTATLLRLFPKPVKGDYQSKWSDIDQHVSGPVGNMDGYHEMKCVQHILNNIPKETHLHLTNSMPVRYANFIGSPEGVRVYANRGTSGIDGCTSTAMGHARNNPEKHILITGDVAFFYDSNAFWQENRPSNLRIVLLNNRGGGIFRVIPGPSRQPELERFFETRHNMTAKPICEQFGLEYLPVHNLEELENKTQDFLNLNGIGVMEIFLDSEDSAASLKKIKSEIAELVGNYPA